MPTGIYKRKPRTEETKERIRQSLLGRKRPSYSEEWKKNISKALKGVNTWSKGKHHSIETRKKISKSRTGWVMPQETREKIRIALMGNKNGKMTQKCLNASIAKNKGVPRYDRRGEKCHLWKGGVTSINEKVRTSLEFKIWRQKVFERDNYTCRECKKRGGRLNAHHIKPFSKFPQERFNVGNGQTLCHSCHKKTDSYGFHIFKK